MGLSSRRCLSNVPNIGQLSKILLVLLLLFHVLGASSLYSRQQQQPPSCHGEERAALLQFKQSFIVDPSASDDDGSYPKVSSWKAVEGNQNSNCCSWDGVQCDEKTGHVVDLDLSSSCLYGPINSSSSLFRLVHLRRLSLADNNFNYSQIPITIKSLSRLRYLDLSFSVFSGQVPSEISQLSKLSSLDLSSTVHTLSGEGLLRLKADSLASLVRNLTSLETLHLSDINISSSVPDSLANLSLSSLALGNCNLYGEFPASLANLTQLTYLSLAMNDFVAGPLSWLGKQTQLTYLDLETINLSGSIPSSLGNLSQLTYLYLSDNQLSGPVPSLFGNLSRLAHLNLGGNRLSGSVPESLFNLRDLDTLNLYENNLHGNFDLCNLQSSITTLQVGWNKLEVPHCNIVNTTLLPKLSTLGLPECNLKEFPDFIRHQQHLTWLDLSKNKLHGQVPKWMWNTSTQSLEFLDIRHNFLSGFGQPNVVLPWVNLHVLVAGYNLLDGSPPIPPQNIVLCSLADSKLTGDLSPLMCNLSTVQGLDLSNNMLSGTILPCLGNFSDTLQVLDLRNNSFHGILPQTYSNTSNLKMIDVSHNQLHGKIPRSLANCMTLQSLVLSANKLSDVFPSWLGSLPELKLLAMHRNQFYGVIENTKENLHFPELRILDLSYNNFTGEFPSEHIFSSNAMRGIVMNQPTYFPLLSTRSHAPLHTKPRSVTFRITASKSSNPPIVGRKLRAAVIGAGPAGSSAAEALAAGGAECFLFERAPSEAKPCGGAIPICMLDEFDIPARLIDRHVTRMRIFSPSNLAVDFGKTLRPDEFIAMLRREVLDSFLRDRAQSRGASLISGLVTRLEIPASPHAPYVVHYTKDNARHALAVDVVVGADGANSRVAKSIKAGSYACAIAFQERIKLTDDKMAYYQDLAEMYVGNDVSPDFYAWVFPKCDHVAVGTGTVCSKQDIKVFQRAIRARASAKISGGKVIKVEAHPIPEHPRPTRVRGRVALIGDAAGYVTKCSGEGIYFAAKSGRMCGEAIIKASEGGERMINEEDLKREYLKEWDAKYITTFRFLDLLQKVFYGSDAAREALVELCGDEYVQRMTFESYLYKKLADGNRWDDAKMVLNTVGSLMRCNVLGRKMEALKI